jgi:hypothetical protein
MASKDDAAIAYLPSYKAHIVSILVGSCCYYLCQMLVPKHVALDGMFGHQVKAYKVEVNFNRGFDVGPMWNLEKGIN